jgi:hypothetical protein
LSMHYDKIFICGSGEEWTSSSAIFVQWQHDIDKLQ